VIVDEVLVSEDMLVGRVGEGWNQATSELALERSGPERFLSTFPLLVKLIGLAGSQPGKRAAVEIGKLVAHLWTLRRLSLGVASALDAGENQAVQAALIKDLGTAFENRVIEVARLLRARFRRLRSAPATGGAGSSRVHPEGRLVGDTARG
jgi:acyl-CoA dehydrogenase